MKTRPKIIETEDELRREAADKAEVDEQVRAAVEVMFARGIISIKPSDIAGFESPLYDSTKSTAKEEKQRR